MKESEQEFMSVAEVLGWWALRDADKIKILLNSSNKKDALYMLLGMSGLVAAMPDDCLKTLNDLLRSGSITAYGKTAPDAETTNIPVQCWGRGAFGCSLIALTEKSILDNCAHKPSREKLLESWRNSYDSRLGRYAGGEYPEMPPEDVREMNVCLRKVWAHSDWQDVRFRTRDIVRDGFLPPIQDDEPIWLLNEVVGYVTLGYPLPVTEAVGEGGKEKLEYALNEIRKKLQDGELVAKGRKWNSQDEWQDISANEFINLTAEAMRDYNVNYTRIGPHLYPLELKFMSADVRRLWPRGEAPIVRPSIPDAKKIQLSPKEVVEFSLHKRGFQKPSLEQIESAIREIWLAAVNNQLSGFKQVASLGRGIVNWEPFQAADFCVPTPPPFRDIVENNIRLNGSIIATAFSYKLLFKRDSVEAWLYREASEPLLNHPTFQTEEEIYPSSGAPGRPSSMSLVVEEFVRRMKEGILETSLSAEAEYLSKWRERNHPRSPSLTAKTIKNKIRDEYNRFVQGQTNA